MSLIFRAFLAALLVSATAVAGDIRTERVQFHKGANSATVQGTSERREGAWCRGAGTLQGSS